MTGPVDPQPLRRLAEQATPGPWTVTPHDGARAGIERIVVDESGEVDYVESSAIVYYHGFLAPRNAAYIAAVSPEVVLHLLDALQERDRLRAALVELRDDCAAATGFDPAQLADWCNETLAGGEA